MRNILIILFLLVSASNFSQNKIYKIGVEDIPYFPHYIYEYGEYKGLAADILNDFAKSKGYIFEYIPMPIVRLSRDYVKGEVDFIYPDNSYWSENIKSKVTVIYSNPVVSYIDGVMVMPKNSNKNKITNLGIVIGFTPFEFLKDIENGNIKLNKNSTLMGLIKQGLAGRVEGVYGNIDIIDYLLQEKLESPGMLVFNPKLPHTKSFYHLSTIKYPEIIEEFNRYLSENQKKIEKWKKEYKIKEHL